MRGRIVANRYRLVAELGRGGMGSVWIAKHVELGMDLALKLMDPHLSEDAAGLARFRREAQAAASIGSPYVVRVYDFGVDNGMPYIAMELLNGESLADRLARVGRMNPLSFYPIFNQIAFAIEAVHAAGVVHRDLKPDNIVLVRDSARNREIAKVIDFGIAKRDCHEPELTGAVATQVGTILGTPYYMSPEQASGAKNIDHRTDIWSLAIIAFESIVGRKPFVGDTLSALIVAICNGPLSVPSTYGDVPAGFDQWFERCAARRPSDRFGSARQAAAELARICVKSASHARGAKHLRRRATEFQQTPNRDETPALESELHTSLQRSHFEASQGQATMARARRHTPLRWTRLLGFLSFVGVATCTVSTGSLSHSLPAPITRVAANIDVPSIRAEPSTSQPVQAAPEVARRDLDAADPVVKVVKSPPPRVSMRLRAGGSPPASQPLPLKSKVATTIPTAHAPAPTQLQAVETRNPFATRQ